MASSAGSELRASAIKLDTSWCNATNKKNASPRADGNLCEPGLSRFTLLAINLVFASHDGKMPWKGVLQGPIRASGAALPL